MKMDTKTLLDEHYAEVEKTAWFKAKNSKSADTIKSKVTWVLDIFENSWESGRKMAETVPGTGDDLVELSIDIGIVLREYFDLVDLPDGYVILGIEVVK